MQDSKNAWILFNRIFSDRKENLVGTFGGGGGKSKHFQVVFKRAGKNGNL